MAENRIHIQHLHSTTATTVSDAVKTDLFDGEIAVLMKDGNEKIAFRNAKDEVVYISTDEANSNSYAPKSHSHNTSSITGGTFDIARIPTGKTNTSVALGNHAHKIKINGTEKTITGDTSVDFGNVETYKGTVTGVTAGNGLTGGGSTTTGSTGVTLAVGAGTGISVSTTAVSINSDYQTKIANGATAYSWGNHADAGYASESKLNTHIETLGDEYAGTTPKPGHVSLVGGDLSARTGEVIAGEAAASNHTHGQYANKTDFNDHTGNTKVHITAAERSDWNSTKSRLDTFLSGATLSGNVIDTLIEIQNYITGDTADAAKIVSDISTISGNLSTHTATSASTMTLGHVKIVGGDLSGKTGSMVTGEAAASYHTHSQYQPKGDYLTSYTENYKGTVTGVTAGTGLTGGGYKGTGATGLTLSHADTSAVDTATTFGPTSNVTGTNNATISIPNFKVDDFGHVISAGTITYTSKDTDTKVTSVDNHYTPTSSTTKSVGATEIITSISMDAKGHVTGVNKGSYTIAKSVPSDAVFTDTHHTGMTVVTNSSTGTATASTIADGSVRLNHIENNAVRSTILLTSDDFCDVEGTAANQITFSINTGTSATTVARGDHSHAKYENQNAFGNVKVGTTTISAKNTRDTLELVTGESILLTPDASNNTVTIAVTSINCGTF